MGTIPAAPLLRQHPPHVSMFLQAFKLLIYIIFLFFYLHIGSEHRFLLLFKVPNYALHVLYSNLHHCRTYLIIVRISLNYSLNLIRSKCLLVASLSVQGTYNIRNSNYTLWSCKLIPFKTPEVAAAVKLFVMPYRNLPISSSTMPLSTWSVISTCFFIISISLSDSLPVDSSIDSGMAIFPISWSSAP